MLDNLYQNRQLRFFSCDFLQSPDNWKQFKNNLYEKEWCPYIKKTFNGFGNAIEYLGKYTHKIAISNSRILSVTQTEITFSARGKKPWDPRRTITISNEEIWNINIHIFPACGCCHMQNFGKTHGSS